MANQVYQKLNHYHIRFHCRCCTMCTILRNNIVQPNPYFKN